MALEDRREGREMETNYYPRNYGIAVYAVSPNLEELPNEGEVFARNFELGPFCGLYYERIGGFRNLTEATEYCLERGLPAPVEPCVPGY